MSFQLFTSLQRDRSFGMERNQENSLVTNDNFGGGWKTLPRPKKYSARIFRRKNFGAKLTRASWTTLRYQLATIVKTKAKKIFLQIRRAWWGAKLRIFFSPHSALSSDDGNNFPGFSAVIRWLLTVHAFCFFFLGNFLIYLKISEAVATWDRETELHRARLMNDCLMDVSEERRRSSFPSLVSILPRTFFFAFLKTLASFLFMLFIPAFRGRVEKLLTKTFRAFLVVRLFGFGLAEMIRCVRESRRKRKRKRSIFPLIKDSLALLEENFLLTTLHADAFSSSPGSVSLRRMVRNTCKTLPRCFFLLSGASIERSSSDFE